MTNVWPRGELESIVDSPAVAAGILDCLANHNRWFFRRVETIEFRDDSIFTRRASLHLSAPASAPRVTYSGVAHVLVPLVAIRKTALINFDARRDGRAVPVVPSEFARRLAEEILSLAAVEVCGLTRAHELEPTMRAVVHRIAQGSEGSARALLDFLRAKGGRVAPPAELLVVDDGAIDAKQVVSFPSTEALVQLSECVGNHVWMHLAGRFAVGWLLLTLLPETEVGGQIILKLSSDEPLDPSPNLPRVQRFLVGVGLRSKPYSISVPAFHDCGQFHFEVAVPSGVDITIARLVASYGAHLPERQVAVDPPAFEHAPRHRIPKPPQRPRRRAHLTTPHFDAVSVVARFRVRIARRGWYRSAVTASLAVTSLMFVGALRFSSFVDTNSVGGDSAQDARQQIGAAVLAALVGAVTTLLLRGPSHALAMRLLSTVRWLAAVEWALPFVVSATLLVDIDASVARAIWWASAGLSAVASVVLSVGYLMSDPTDGVKVGLLKRGFFFVGTTIADGRITRHVVPRRLLVALFRDDISQGAQLRTTDAEAYGPGETMQKTVSRDLQDLSVRILRLVASVE